MYEKELYEYAVDKLQSFNDVHIIGHSKNKGAILSFTIDNIHSNDIGLILDQHNIASKNRPSLCTTTFKEIKSQCYC